MIFMQVPSGPEYVHGMLCQRIIKKIVGMSSRDVTCSSRDLPVTPIGPGSAWNRVAGEGGEHVSPSSLPVISGDSACLRVM